MITQPAVLSATVTPAMVTCFGANDGRITISSPAGGYGSYQYSINGGTSWQGSGIFTNLAPATYNVRSGMQAIHPVYIMLNRSTCNNTARSFFLPALANTDVTCFGGNDGTITISCSCRRLWHL